jgi:hypothetical protein
VGVLVEVLVVEVFHRMQIPSTESGSVSLEERAHRNSTVVVCVQGEGQHPAAVAAG